MDGWFMRKQGQKRIAEALPGTPHPINYFLSQTSKIKFCRENERVL